MDKLSKLLAMRSFKRPILSDEDKELIKEHLMDIVTDDMEGHELIRKITDLTPYLTNGQPDEDKMRAAHKFINTANIDPRPDETSFMDSGVVIRYKYEGPQDQKNRDFCSYMMRTYRESFFRREDINQMSFSAANNAFGVYSIWEYKGSYNCRHAWVAYIFRLSDQEDVDSNTVVRRSNDESSKENERVK